MKKSTIFLIIIIAFTACTSKTSKVSEENSTIPVIFDTDANNELDDQHALAYLLLNDTTFNTIGVTVNATYNGGNLKGHYDEAKRVIQLCDKLDEVPLLKGSESDFESIKQNIELTDFDGSEAVSFIISEAKKYKKQKLVILAVGKLTNVALAVLQEPSIIPNIRLVWLGSNYPERGEYNLENDIPAMNYLLSTEIDFEMAVCRYGKPSGTDAVRVTQQDIIDNLKGKGPVITDSITGRHGKQFANFGDYSVNLFEHVDYYGNPPSRALFDMAAVAIVKNPNWAESKLMAAPSMVDGNWIDHPGNKRKIILWENFNSDAILQDFYSMFEE